VVVVLVVVVVHCHWPCIYVSCQSRTGSEKRERETEEVQRLDSAYYLFLGEGSVVSICLCACVCARVCVRVCARAFVCVSVSV
jgi:hypothetical protein